MKKIYATLLMVSLAVGILGCKAFKDYYDTEQQPAVPNETETSTSMVPVTTDYTKDLYDCTAAPGVSVKLSSAAASVTKNDGWTLTGDQSTPLVTALKLGPYTTRFDIKKTQDEGTMALTFIVKQTDKDKFVACQAGYSGLVKQGGPKTFETTLNSGEITLESYNKDEGDGKVLNSGKYTFNFTTKGDPKAYDIAGAFYIKTGSPVKQ